MARRWRRGDGGELLFVKRVPAGWVFQMASPWLLGRPRYYLVSDSKRAEFVARYRKLMWRHMAAFMAAAMAVGLILAAAGMAVGLILGRRQLGFVGLILGWRQLGFWLVPMLWNSVLLTTLLISIVGAIIVGALFNGYLWWTLRPLLVDVPRTTERITWGEQLRAWAGVVPPIRELIFSAILLAILFALAAYLTLASGRWDIDGLIGTLLIGLMVAYCLVLLNAKRKTTAGPWS
jgi:hypothetical protein